MATYLKKKSVQSTEELLDEKMSSNNELMDRYMVRPIETSFQVYRLIFDQQVPYTNSLLDTTE